MTAESLDKDGDCLLVLRYSQQVNDTARQRTASNSTGTTLPCSYASLALTDTHANRQRQKTYGTFLLTYNYTATALSLYVMVFHVSLDNFPRFNS